MDKELEVRDGLGGENKMLNQAQYPGDRQTSKRNDEVVELILDTVEMLHLGLQYAPRYVVSREEGKNDIAEPI
jgi:hypothetical protein